MTVHNARYYCNCIAANPKRAETRGKRAALLIDSQWFNGETVKIGFLSGDPVLRARVRAVAERWIAPGMAQVQFQWVEASAADVRIDFAQGNGSWSYLGTYCNQVKFPEATMNFGWLTEESDEATLRRVVLHEFGHMLGLIHEHQNPCGAIEWNKPAVIADLSGPPGYWDEAMIYENIFKKYDPNDVDATPVDVKSIMMYPIPQSWTIDDFSADFNDEISAADRLLIKQVYA